MFTVSIAGYNVYFIEFYVHIYILLQNEKLNYQVSQLITAETFPQCK